ncbi:Hsp20 family protein [Shewanella sp. WXL01]|uniref:Hsp20 family protein n=1 Tax=Shewanella maritima TaxID=2520507 RepID=A0A411PLR0_9GAMM|nr:MULTISPECIES: Hsp20 family protein [Shewanella]NKF51600.1 Hsp20 family protein [Shewanella sp. WXL01]QBF84480.1 Hsp20 family protein [Shewanella maritima]
MRNFTISQDLAPLYRSAIGFDRLARMAEHAASNSGNSNGYPPYNIELMGENRYRITMAVAGFAMSELEITSEGEKLLVKGNKPTSKKDDKKYLHQGIAERGFERTFQLADHVRVVGAELENGLLNIDLVRELPEAMKPRKIEINQARVIED